MSQVVCCNDMDWIIEKKLAVGNMDAVANGSVLQSKGIRGIISVRNHLTRPISYYKQYGISVLHIPVFDSETTNLGKYFPVVYRFIEKILKSGSSVIVNCYAGISRSTTLATSYLMRKYRLSAKNAMNLVKSKRPCFNPNEGFRVQLRNYEKVLQLHGLL
jgi:protein-tyrosine phosphatase